MVVHKYDFEPFKDSDYNYNNQKGHSDYNLYKANKDAQRYQGYGGTRTSRLLFENNSGDSGNAPTIYVEDGSDGEERQINVDAFVRYDDGSVEKVEDKNQVHKYGENEGPGIFSGTDDYNRTQRDIQSKYAESTKSTDAVRTLAFQQLEELQDDENIDATEAQDVISNILESNKVTPDFQEYLDTEGAAEGSEIAKCKEDFDSAKDSYKEAQAKWADVVSGNDPELKQIKAETQKRRDEYYKVLDKYKEQIGTLADDIKFVDQEADESMEKIQEYDSAIVENEAQRNEVFEQKQDVEAERLGISNKLGSIEDTLADVKSNLTAESAKLSNIDDEISKTDDKDKKAKLKSDKSSIKSQISKLKEQQKKLEAEQSQWQKQKEEADKKIEALENVYNVLVTQKEALEEQRDIEAQNYEKIQKEQEALHNELEEQMASWTEKEHEIVSDYYAHLNDYRSKYIEKYNEAVDNLNSKRNAKDDSLEALTQAKADAYEKFLEWKEQKRIEEEQRAKEEAAAAAQSSGTAETGSTATSSDVAATASETTVSTSSSTTAGTQVSAPTTTRTGASTRTSNVSSSNPLTTGSASVAPQQIESTQQLSNAKLAAEDALNSTTSSMNNIYDGNTNKLKSFASNKTAAYDGFIAKLDKIDSAAASAINAKKLELNDVEKDYGNVRKDIVQTEIAISSKDVSLAVANAELESLIDARGILSAVKTEGLTDEQKESLANLKKNADKAIRKKEAEIDKLNNLESNLEALKSKRDELRARRDNIRADLKAMMSVAANVHSSDAPDLQSYNGAYDKAVNDYDREEESELTSATSSFNESVDNNKTAISSSKDTDIENAKKAGEKYKFDPNVKVELDKDDEEVIT